MRHPGPSQRVDPRVVHRELTSNVISTGELSEPTQIVLHREDLTEAFENYPEQAIANLHRAATVGEPDPDLLFALSELSFRHAEDAGKPESPPITWHPRSTPSRSCSPMIRRNGDRRRSPCGEERAQFHLAQRH